MRRTTGLPSVGDIMLIPSSGVSGVAGVVTNRIEGKRGSRFTIVAGGEHFSQKIETKPMTRLPAEWSWVSAVHAYEDLLDAD